MTQAGQAFRSFARAARQSTKIGLVCWMLDLPPDDHFRSTLLRRLAKRRHRAHGELDLARRAGSSHANGQTGKPILRPASLTVSRRSRRHAMIDRAQAAEEQFIRNEEAERRHFETLELAADAARIARSEREVAEARRVRRAAREEIFPHARRDVRRGLNRLIVASWGESLTLDEAMRFVHDGDQQRGLEQHLEQRRAFRLALGDAVAAWGGLPAHSASFGARCLSWARSLRRLAGGAHGGDAYAACARATELARSECDGVLRLSLPPDLRLSIERQRAQLELDAGKLRRLRWGVNKPAASDDEDARRPPSSLR